MIVRLDCPRCFDTTWHRKHYLGWRGDARQYVVICVDCRHMRRGEKRGAVSTLID